MKDKHTVDKKRARNGQATVIYEEHLFRNRVYERDIPSSYVIFWVYFHKQFIKCITIKIGFCSFFVQYEL